MRRQAVSDKAYDDKVVRKLGQGKSTEAKVPDYYKVAKEFGPPVAVPAIRASEYFAEHHTPAGGWAGGLVGGVCAECVCVCVWWWWWWGLRLGQ